MTQVGESRGLYLLEAQHGVLLVDTERHQDVLRRHAPAPGSPAQVIAELAVVGPCDGGPATPGAVEARIDGRLVGALAAADAAWYRPLLERASRRGLRLGGEGHVRDDGSGRLLVELFLPAGADPEVIGPAEFPRPSPPAGPLRPGRTSRVPIRIGVLAAVLAATGSLGYYQWPRIAEWTGVSRAATVEAAPIPTTVPAPEPTTAPPPAPTTAPAPLAAATSKVLPPITNGGCDPNYSGACVPIASHVECAGPGQEGLLLVRGPFRVTGTDVYVLDPDGDGIACGPPAPPTTLPDPAAAAPTEERTPSATAENADEDTGDSGTSDSGDSADPSTSADDDQDQESR